MPRHAIGLDFGTLSARALVVDIETGESDSFEQVYEHGILEQPGRPEIARQDPDDYLVAAEGLLSRCAHVANVIVGIGVDTTASTPVPVDGMAEPASRGFPGNLGAYAWLWKDHSAQAEADELNALLKKTDPKRLARVGAYSAEWLWAKMLNCSRSSPEVFDASSTWLEQCDFVTAAMTGNVLRGKCAAGHKGLFWNGFPQLTPELNDKVQDHDAFPCSTRAGGLTEQWAAATGIPEGTPVAVGGVDAHLGAVGAGVGDGTVCMVLGTSACHIAVAPYSAQIESIEGISGVADDSVLPGMLGIEAGQAAFGDLMDWSARQLGGTPDVLTAEAAAAPQGANGLLVLDFHSGNRCPFADASLTGVVLGQTLKTTRGDSFRAVIEACAFGIRQILETLERSKVPVIDLIACGGVAEKNDFVLQTIADVTGKVVSRSRTAETCALGAAIFGAVAGKAFEKAEDAQRILCRADGRTFVPAAANYGDLYSLWVDAQRHFARETDILKRLLNLRDAMP